MHPLLQQVRAVAHQARRLVLREAFARWLCIVLLTMIVMEFADYVFRFREAPLRWLCFVTVASVAVWRWHKSVGPLLADRCSDRQVAQWIERSCPELREELSSAVSFLQFPVKDLRFGSEALRADVVRRATATIADRNLLEMLDTRSARRSLGTLLAVTALVGALCAWDSQSALLAMRRLGMPWSNEVWPRKNHLSFIKPPEVLAHGQDFEVELVDENGRLPEEVTMLYWFEGDDEEAARAYRMTFSGGKMKHRLPAVNTPFRYRAVGGDDRDMSWATLRVVVPPKIVESRITVQPPAYTGRSAETAERRIRALAGSNVALHIRLDRPVSAAVLCFQSPTAQQKIPTKITPDGRNCRLSERDGQSWTLTTSGTYGWELTDRDGMTLTVDDNTEVDVVPDLPPVVSIESPETDSAFTARALVPVRCSVKDDLAIQRIEFHANETTLALVEFAPPIATEPGKIKKSEEHNQHSVEHLWDLAGVPDLKPGTSLPFEVVAMDFRPQTSPPASGTIRILSDPEFQQRLDEGQVALLRLFNEALRLQRVLHNQTGSLVAQLKSTKQLSAEDGAVWPALDPGQRRVATVLAGEEGASRRVDQLLLDLSVNRWEAPELVVHLTTIQGDLRRVSEQLIPPIQQRLSQADRRLRFEAPEIPSVLQAWSDAAGGQEQVVAALESLVDQLAQWDRYRNLAQEVRQVLDEHNAIVQETRDLPTAGRDVAQLTAEERAKLERLAQRLSDLAAQVDRMQSRLDQLHQRLAQSNPSAAKSLRDALQVLERDPVSGGLRESGRAVVDNRLGAATRGLEETRGGLQKLLAALEQQPERDVSQLEQLLAKAIAGFAARQEAVIADTTAWEKRPEKPTAVAAAARELAKTQADLAADVGDLARRTPESSGYAMALELAARPMTQASVRLANSQFDATTLQVEREALDFLKDLLVSLARNEPRPRETPESESPQQSPGKQPETRQPSLAELKLIRLVQLEILRRTSDLEDRRNMAGQLSEGQERELEELATRQRQLAELLEQVVAPPPAESPETNSVPPMPKPSSGSKNDHPRNKPSLHLSLSAHAKLAGWLWRSECDATGAQAGASRTQPQPPPAQFFPRMRLVNWTQREEGPTIQDRSQNKPPTPGNRLDRALLDELPPAPQRKPGQSPTPAGEDAGAPSSGPSPLIELSRQMRQIESRLRGRDTAPTTQQMQRRVAAQLTSLIEQLQQPQSGDEQQPPSKSGDGKAQKPAQPKPSPASNPDGKAGSGTGGTATDKEGVSNWARRVWGVLPDRVRQQIQNLGDEQFLPEYEEVIRHYYDRLSERGRKQP